MNRLFFALDLLEQDKEAINSWRENSTNFSGRAVKAANFHITLHFVGLIDITKQQELITLIDKLCTTKQAIDSFTVTGTHVGWFDKPKVLYLGFSSFPDELVQLALHLKQLSTLMQPINTPTNYTPHITLYRKAPQQPQHSTVNIPVTIKSFSLYQSNSTPSGVSYQKLNTWPLLNI